MSDVNESSESGEVGEVGESSESGESGEFFGAVEPGLCTAEPRRTPRTALVGLIGALV